MQSRTIKILITVAIVIGGAGVLVFSSLADAEFYKRVYEVTEAPDSFEGKTLRVHGFVEAGSIDEQIVDQTTKRTFILEHACPTKAPERVESCAPGSVRRLLVRSEGPTPDTFKDLAEVVAKGTLIKEGDQYVLHATELMAKCPSKYEENKRPSTFGQAESSSL